MIQLIPFMIVGVLLGGGIFGIQEYRINNVKAKLEAAQGDLKFCVNERKISYEIEQEYMDGMLDLKRRYNAIRVRTPSACVPLKSASGNHEAGNDGAVKGNGLRTEWLLDYAASAEEIKLQIIACQNYLQRVSK